MIEFTVRILPSHPHEFAIAIPAGYEGAFAHLRERCRAGYVTAKLAEPHRPRTTGYRSENSHSHGHFADIAEQLSDASVTYSPEEVGRALKLMAMKAGEWPAKRNAKGETIVDPITKALQPLSEADSTMAESARLIGYIHWWADTQGFWLTEYIDGVPQRVYGGARESA